METGYIMALGLLALVLGGIIGFIAAPAAIETQVPVEVIKEVPGTCPEAPECEVADPVVCAVCQASVADLKDEAIDKFLEEYFDRDKLGCGGDEYDEEQIEVKKVYDEWAVEYDDEDYTTSLTIKLKYLDGDVDEKCYKTFDVELDYDSEDDEYDVAYVVA